MDKLEVNITGDEMEKLMEAWKTHPYAGKIVVFRQDKEPYLFDSYAELSNSTCHSTEQSANMHITDDHQTE